MKKYNIILVIFLLPILSFGQLQEPNYNSVTKVSNANINEQSITAEDGYLGAKATGKYSVWYGCGGNGQQRNHVAKPFIYIEGINLTPNNVEKSNDPVFDSDTYLQLMRDGFDIVQLDFVNNSQYI